METVVERPAALDIHKEHVTACVRRPGEGGAREQHAEEFSTTVAGLLTLRDWLAAHRVTQVTMEATGVFWKPVWAILEDDFGCVLVSARHVKQVPGPKTDVSDAVWLCQLADAGLLQASFVPPKPIRSLRTLSLPEPLVLGRPGPRPARNRRSSPSMGDSLNRWPRASGMPNSCAQRTPQRVRWTACASPGRPCARSHEGDGKRSRRCTRSSTRSSLRIASSGQRTPGRRCTTGTPSSGAQRADPPERIARSCSFFFPSATQSRLAGHSLQPRSANRASRARRTRSSVCASSTSVTCCGRVGDDPPFVVPAVRRGKADRAIGPSSRWPIGSLWATPGDRARRAATLGGAMPTGRQLLAGLVGAALSVSAAGSAGAATERFGFTGAPQSWRVPEGITSATFDLYGSAGEGLWGGYGARVRSTIPVTPGETLLIYVGGNHTAQPTTGDPTPANGGFNGGGDAGSPSSRSGGGATDVRRSAALADRLLIAGGGGGSGDEWNTADGSSAGGAGGQGGKTADNPGSGGGGGGATASAGGAAGAAGPGTGPTDNGCCWNPGLAGAPGTFGQGGAGAASQDGGGLPGGGGGGGLYGGGGGGSGGRFQNSEAPGEGGGGGGGSSLGAKPEDVTIEKSPTLYAQGTATVTYEDLVDMTVKLTRRPGRVLRRGDRVTVEAVIRVRKGRADKVVLRVESVRGFRLRRSNVGGPRCRLECEPDWVIGPSSPGHHAVYELTYRGGVSRPTFSVSVTEQDARDLTPSDNVAVMRGDKKWKRTPKR